MLKRFSKYIDTLFEKFKIKNYKDIFYFLLIVFVMHIVWKAWAFFFNHEIFGYPVLAELTKLMIKMLKSQSAWILNHIFNEPTVIKGDFLIFDNFSRIGVTYGCSGLKQFYQFSGLIILFYGSWKKKIWYIPLGILILHITNLFRIFTLSLVVIYHLDRFSSLHDWFFRPLFYIIMFLLWVWWVERLAKPNRIIPSSV